MEKRNAPCCEGFELLDRSEMMTVEGGNLKKVVDIVRALARFFRALSDLSECVDDFIEGYQEGLEEARGY